MPHKRARFCLLFVILGLALAPQQGRAQTLISRVALGTPGDPVAGNCASGSGVSSADDTKSWPANGSFQCPGNGPQGNLPVDHNPLVATCKVNCLNGQRLCGPKFGTAGTGVESDPDGRPFASVFSTELINPGPPPNGCADGNTLFFKAHTDKILSDSPLCNVEPPPDPCYNGGCTPGYHQEVDCHSEVPIDECGCCYDSSPIVISLRGNGYRFSDARGGVMFDINGLGKILWIAWPLQADDAWLALDRNDNGTIDSGAELFGNVTRLRTGVTASNGYEALAEFDANGDGVIDRRDPIFARLRLWTDVNRDGQSQPDELLTLRQANVESISVQFEPSSKEDRFGNQFRYRAEVTMRNGRHRFSYDVFPVAAPVAGLTPVALAACSIEPGTKRAVTSATAGPTVLSSPFMRGTSRRQQ